MKIYVNEFHEIKALRKNDTGDDSLREYEVDDDFLSNYCDTVKLGFCYEVGEDAEGNAYTSIYPFKDFSLLESIQQEHEMTNKKIKSMETPPELAIAMQFAAFSFTDQQAIRVPNMYPLWSRLDDGTTLTTQEEAVDGTEITRIRGDDGKLYKVIKTHDKQSSWAPDTAHSLFTPIGEPDAGTKENPIIWVDGMEAEKDLYYTDAGFLYLCIESSGIGLYGKPKDLPRYFQKV